jgi:hypothetical protein
MPAREATPQADISTESGLSTVSPKMGFIKFLMFLFYFALLLLKAHACEVSNELKDEVVARHPAIYDQLVKLVVGFCGGHEKPREVTQSN